MTDLRFVFRPLERTDFPMLTEWLNRQHVAERWGGPMPPERVEQEFGPDIDSTVLRRYVAELEGRPVGFIQSYVVKQDDTDWWPDETDPGARGIDQFLAHAEDLGRGLGSRMVAQFVARLFEDPSVTKVQTDPAPDNARAIRAYEKAGFRQIGIVATPDGDAMLMLVHRTEWAT